MIEVQNLTKRYGRFTAVDGVSFTVEKGQILGFLGPNGAGKTTTMRILTGYMPATTGRAVVAGFDVFDQAVEAKRRTGYLPETPPLYPEMTVREYLQFCARIKGVPAKAQRAQVDTSMEKARVADMANRHCAKLSKGYRQRVGLAQAILHNPEVLILDEPTAGLDPKQIMETRDLIKSLAGDHTIVLSTHILPEVAQTCQRVVIINKGKVVAVDTPDNLTSRLHGSRNLYVQVDAGSAGVTGAGAGDAAVAAAAVPADLPGAAGTGAGFGSGTGASVAAALRSLPGVTGITVVDQRDGIAGLDIETETDRDVRREVARTVIARGWGLLELRPLRMSLEEIFLQLTTQEGPDARDAAAFAPPPTPPPSGPVSSEEHDTE